MIRPDEKPVITGIYDPVGRTSDGTITSQAPVIVWGKHFDWFDLEHSKWCLIPATDYEGAIEVAQVHKLANDQMIVSLPILKPGEYFPAVKLLDKGEEVSVYVFPFSCVVRP